MELNAKIMLNPDGSYDILLEEKKGSDVFMEVSDAEIKQISKAYAESTKKKKEVLKKEVEAAKKVGKKALVKAFLKKAIEIKRKKKAKKTKTLFKREMEETKAFLEGFKKAVDREKDDMYRNKYSSGYYYDEIMNINRKQNLYEPRYVELLPLQEKLLDWFKEEFVMYDSNYMYSDAREDFQKIIKAIIKAGDNFIKGKDNYVISYEENNIEPPYGSHISLENMNRLLSYYEGADYVTDQEIEIIRDEDEDEDDYEDDYDEDERPYNYQILIKFIEE